MPESVGHLQDSVPYALLGIFQFVQIECVELQSDMHMQLAPANPGTPPVPMHAAGQCVTLLYHFARDIGCMMSAHGLPRPLWSRQGV